MNIIDWIVLGIIGLSVLIGLYRGFIASVASMGGTLGCLALSYWLSPKLVEYLQQHTSLSTTLMSYTDAATRLKDSALSAQSVAGLNADGIAGILSRVSLPAPLDSLLKSNLEQQAFRSTDMVQNVGNYVTQTIVGAIMNVICFILCFVGLMLVFHILLNLLKAVFRFPVLKQLNAVTGGLFGLLRGVLLCFVAFALLPLFQTIVPIENIQDLVAASSLAPLFNNGSLILSIMNGKLF